MAVNRRAAPQARSRSRRRRRAKHNCPRARAFARKAKRAGRPAPGAWIRSRRRRRRAASARQQTTRGWERAASVPPFRLPALACPGEGRGPGAPLPWVHTKTRRGQREGKGRGFTQRPQRSREAQRCRRLPQPSPRHCGPGFDPGAATHGPRERHWARAGHGLLRLRLAMTKEGSHQPPRPTPPCRWQERAPAERPR